MPGTSVGRPGDDARPDIAIVGMAAMFGPLPSLEAFQTAVLRGECVIGERPANRWKGGDAAAEKHLGGKKVPGGWMASLALYAGEFHIPPNEIPDILPQHLLMLKTAAAAMADAGISSNADHERTGVVIGADFDHGATDFHLRWDLHDAAREWARKAGRDLDEGEMARWVQSLQDALGPPLTSDRTLGALPSVIASRIAREFRFGGPSFVVSDHAASGLKALEIAFRSLSRGETDFMLAGAVDLAGDVRAAVLDNAIQPFSDDGRIRPFDKGASGALPGEGAVAVALKRRDQAEKDGDRIYALVKGVGRARGGGVGTGLPRVEAVVRSLESAFSDAGAPPGPVGLVETHGQGGPEEDRVEAEALHRFFSARLDKNDPPPAIGSATPNLGRTGAASGLASLVKASLCLHREIIPPLVNYTRPAHEVWQKELFHLPAFPQYWVRNRKDGPRRAVVGAITPEGGAAHVVLEGHETDAPGVHGGPGGGAPRSPLGPEPFGLFAIEGDDPHDLLTGLDALARHLERCTRPGASPGSEDGGAMRRAAEAWHRRNGSNPGKPFAVTLGARDIPGAREWIEPAARAVSEDRAMSMNGSGGVCYAPGGPDRPGGIAFVFPGSGNHHVGMGREICARWPEIPGGMDRRTPELSAQMLPRLYAPRRTSWAPGWEREALEALESDPLHMIFGQVIHGGLMSDLLRNFGVAPDAAIGYSLGETASYFALGAWPDRGVMLKRMRRTNLFRTELAGPYRALKKAWGIPENETVQWRAAVVNRPARTVRAAISDRPGVRLLIVNTPDECVIGGLKDPVAGAIRALKCEAIYLKGVVSVHCDAVAPCARAYRDLHLFPTTRPDHIRFYSCALARAHDLTDDGAADSILNQALHGFDFPATIQQAYKDGVGVFIETGPRDSCTRMIRRILGDKPHLAVSASVRGEAETVTVLKTLGALIAHRIPVNLDKLYGAEDRESSTPAASPETPARPLTLEIGGPPPSPPAFPGKEASMPAPEKRPATAPAAEAGERREPPGGDGLPGPAERRESPGGDGLPGPGERRESPGSDDIPRPGAGGPPAGLFSDLIQPMRDAVQSAADAHQTFLSFSEDLTRGYGDAFNLQTSLIEAWMKQGGAPVDVLPGAGESAPGFAPEPADPRQVDPAPPSAPPAGATPPAYSREMCMEFAIGSAARVLGPDFAEIDGYDVRVRLPDEPLMLVDRILSVEGEKRSLGPGSLVTEHDVLPGAWYLDGGKAPVCISVEAGQADLFLCAYMGIDFEARGKRSYRLLDARVAFHRGLPEPGDVIRYHIEIEKFIRQGETWLFFFNFTGAIDGRPLITMTNGCAGFFTDKEIRESGGILPADDDVDAPPGVRPPDWKELAPLSRESYDADALDALRRGDLAGCFGEPFKGMRLAESLRLPGGRLKLIDRVLLLDPHGGRFKLGVIRAEADIHPDDWFLTCHFKDDMVMPGTLMYECCAHTLRVLLQRLGWVTDKIGVCHEPVIGVRSVLKCRGPVTPKTRRVVYEVELKEIGYGPEPYVVADAHMYADDHYIVYFQDITTRMTGVDREEIERGWERRRDEKRAVKTDVEPSGVLFDYDRLLEFALGSPARAFGAPYQPFERGRFIARLPNPPYLFISRVLQGEPKPWELKPGGWITAQFDVREDGWYFQADRSGVMPFSVLLEIALQPCGWLAAYAGSALRSEKDLRFRNLGGEAVQRREIFPDAGSLTVRARLTRASEAGDMIIEGFDFQVLQDRAVLYEGKTDFGFFTEDALAQQVGVRGADDQAWRPDPAGLKDAGPAPLEDEPPYTPDEAAAMGPWKTPRPGLAMPGRAIRMIDEIECLIPDGGPHGLGFIRGVKHVDPAEWFFKAHFFQDPVCPG
ncbi:MAG: type I polyketide synthase, partial [Desulfobacterales bacterium]|nr:type I polyketide synthase [Desulfobacterales bacterium]